jgi:hypothetical protein
MLRLSSYPRTVLEQLLLITVRPWVISSPLLTGQLAAIKLGVVEESERGDRP